METEALRLVRTETTGSEPTYEEWKHLTQGLDSVCDFRSEPTYEEWKLRNEVVVYVQRGPF